MAKWCDTIFPRVVEEEFQSYKRDYMGQSLDETVSIIEQGDSSDEVDIGDSVIDQLMPSDMEMELEANRVDKFIKESCKCTLGLGQTPCSDQLSREEIVEHREQCFELDKSELDMVVIGQLKAHSKDMTTNNAEATQRKYVEFYYKSKRICRSFLFLHTLSQKRYENLLTHWTDF